MKSVYYDYIAVIVRMQGVCGQESDVIDFEEELKKFHPSLEVEDAEDAIYNHDLSDMTDVLVAMFKEAKDAEKQGDQV